MCHLAFSSHHGSTSLINPTDQNQIDSNRSSLHKLFDPRPIPFFTFFPTSCFPLSHPPDLPSLTPRSLDLSHTSSEGAVMKIQCDVCGKEEASVFCCADEAALCSACDHRVHRANKVAGKHRRFSLLLPTTDQAPPFCDICQKKRGFIFCKEDRAILCKDCDEPIHSANELTMKHSRFLLTGARLSSAPIASSSPPPEPEEPEHGTTTTTTGTLKTKHGQLPAADSSVISSTTTSNNTGSSISEYLIKMLPGWRVDDLLVDDAAAAAVAAGDGICKTNELLPFLEADLETSGPGEKAELPIWITAPDQPAIYYLQGFGAKDVAHTSRWSDDALFTVPQIPQVSGTNKRRRSSLWYF